MGKDKNVKAPQIGGFFFFFLDELNKNKQEQQKNGDGEKCQPDVAPKASAASVKTVKSKRNKAK